VTRAAGQAALEQLRRQCDGAGLTAGELDQLGEELYGIAEVLLGRPRLRRLLANPATDDSARAAVLTGLLRGRVSAPAVALAELAVTLHWTSPWGLVDALEATGDHALLAAADADGSLDRVEDELFQFGRILDPQSQLTGLFDEASVPAEQRVRLLRQLLDGKVGAVTLRLLEHAVASERRRGLVAAINALLETSARRRSRSIARVVSAAPLTAAQAARLEAALERIYGQSVSLRQEVEPAVRGGLVVRIGDEVIDGSVAARFAAVRQALAGTR